MQRAVVHQGVPFGVTILRPSPDGSYATSQAVLTPAITADGCLVALMGGEVLVPSLKQNQRAKPYINCWRMVEMMKHIKWIRLEEDARKIDDVIEAVTMDDVIEAVEGGRDIELLRRLRIDLGMSNDRLTSELDRLSRLAPPQHVRNKIGAMLQMFVEDNGCFEDFVAECEACERTVDAA